MLKLVRACEITLSYHEKSRIEDLEPVREDAYSDRQYFSDYYAEDRICPLIRIVIDMKDSGIEDKYEA